MLSSCECVVSMHNYSLTAEKINLKCTLTYDPYMYINPVVSHVGKAKCWNLKGLYKQKRYIHLPYTLFHGTHCNLILSSKAIGCQ